MCRTNRLFNIALERTADSDHAIPMSAILVKGSRILSYGVNGYKTHPRQISRYDEWRSIHAELDAILGVSKRKLEGATLYVARKRKDGSPGISKPCSSCIKLIRSSGIKRVVYFDGMSVVTSTI